MPARAADINGARKWPRYGIRFCMQAHRPRIFGTGLAAIEERARWDDLQPARNCAHIQRTFAPVLARPPDLAEELATCHTSRAQGHRAERRSSRGCGRFCARLSAYCGFETRGSAAALAARVANAYDALLDDYDPCKAWPILVAMFDALRRTRLSILRAACLERAAPQVLQASSTRRPRCN